MCGYVLIANAFTGFEWQMSKCVYYFLTRGRWPFELQIESKSKKGTREKKLMGEYFYIWAIA